MTFDASKPILALTGLFLLPSGVSFADTAILVALPSEQSALSREVRMVGQSVELAQHRVSIGYHRGEKLYIVSTGAGNLNSAMVTQALLTRYKIDRVISIGVAGYIGEEGGGTTEILRQAQDDNVGKENRGRTRDCFIEFLVLTVVSAFRYGRACRSLKGVVLHSLAPARLARVGRLRRCVAPLPAAWL